MARVLPLFLLAVSAHAAGPAFDLRIGLARSTHIVVVSEGAVVDGQVSILEAWRGPLRVGARLELPALKAFADRERFFLPEGRPGADPPPLRERRLPNLQRMVLFLREDGGELGPAIHGRIESSTLWVEEKGPEGVHGWGQWGTSRQVRVMYPWTEPLLNSWVRGWDEKLPKLMEARKIRDPVRRAAAIAPLCDCWPIHQWTFPALRECGAAAIPHLWKMLRHPDPNLGMWQPVWPVVRALHAVGGREEKAKLLQFINDELDHFQQLAAKVPDPLDDRADQRVARLQVCISSFVERRDPRMRPIARRVLALTRGPTRLHRIEDWVGGSPLRRQALRILNRYKALPDEMG
ncbi:MAG: hypothetical protein AAGD14_01160 [Planctomycetota bacterium]